MENKNERRAHLNCVYSNQKLHKSYTVRKYVTKDGQGLYSIHVSSDGGDWRRWRAKDNVDSTEKEVAFILLVDRFLAGRFGSREDIISFIASKV
ncbi:hypothetical protein [uncultured Phascolarctobacterium sp.]|uniref:hypothetical protein n=1 Tax=uncultured Phascolarctobacterium sp. TaxID=512296 RepID=UPI0025DADEB3|nr:hypothetical protein [uncultured Phascolarctobacterium sp.]